MIRISSGSPMMGVLLLPLLAACAGELPPPQTRPIILYSGERIRADAERMLEIERWMRPQLDDIEFNPSFLIRVMQEDVSRYPWDTLDVEGDTADIRIQVAAPDAETPYLIYAHYRLMQERGELEEWLPDAEGLEGFEAEREILRRVADVWLLGRAVFDTHPYGPLDELLWAHEFGYLDDFILATQGERFATAAEEYRSRNPGREAEFRSWFERTFEREEPGFVGGVPEEVAGAASGTVTFRIGTPGR